jgi:hypothetical protein
MFNYEKPNNGTELQALQRLRVPAFSQNTLPWPASPKVASLATAE